MTTNVRRVRRGDVFIGDPDPVVGREQGGRRPLLVVSVGQMNRSPAQMAITVPLTTTNRRNKLHVRVEPPAGGLDRVSYAMPEMVRSVSTMRLQRQLGRMSSDTVDAVADRIGLLVGLGRSH
jgi:mRNA interferase MazF